MIDFERAAQGRIDACRLRREVAQRILRHDEFADNIRNGVNLRTVDAEHAICI